MDATAQAHMCPEHGLIQYVMRGPDDRWLCTIGECMRFVRGPFDVTIVDPITEAAYLRGLKKAMMTYDDALDRLTAENWHTERRLIEGRVAVLNKERDELIGMVADLRGQLGECEAQYADRLQECEALSEALQCVLRSQAALAERANVDADDDDLARDLAESREQAKVALRV